MASPSCSASTFDKVYAEAMNAPVSFIRALRQLYEEEYGNTEAMATSFRNLSEEEKSDNRDYPAIYDELLDYAAELEDRDRKSLFKNMFGKSTLDDSSVNKVIHEETGYSNYEIETITESFANIYHIVIDELMQTDEGSKQGNMKFLNPEMAALYARYKDEHNNVEPTMDYLIKNISLNTIKQSIINYIVKNYKFMENANGKKFRYNEKLKLLAEALINTDRIDAGENGEKNNGVASYLMWKIKDVIYYDLGIKMGKTDRIAVDFDQIDETGEFGNVSLDSDVKDGWMTERDKENPLKDLPVAVSVFLSRYSGMKEITDINGNKKIVVATDALNIPKRAGSNELATTILTLVSGATSLEEMKIMLRRGVKENPILSKVLADLDDSLEFAQAFWTGFHKCDANLIGIKRTEHTAWIDNFIFGVQNRTTYLNYVLYNSKAVERGETATVNPIFKDNEEGKRELNNVEFSKFLQLIDTNEENEFGIWINNDNYTADFNDTSDPDLMFTKMRKMFEYMGVKIKDSDIHRIVRMKNTRKSVLYNIYKFASIIKTNSKNQLTLPMIMKSEREMRPVLNAMFSEIKKSKSLKARMLRINDSSYSTHVMPNKFSNDMNALLYFKNMAEYYIAIKEEGKLKDLVDALHSYIEQNYLKDSSFTANLIEFYRPDLLQDKRPVDIGDGPDKLKNRYVIRDKNNNNKVISNKIILSEWIERLYNTTVDDFKDENSFINNFTQYRIMSLESGGKQTMVNRMSTSQNMQSYLHDFLISSLASDKEKVLDENDNHYAHTALFTSGDSRTMRVVSSLYHGKIQSKSDHNFVLYPEKDGIVDRLVKIAIAEARRMHLQSKIKSNILDNETDEEKRKVALANMEGVLTFGDEPRTNDINSNNQDSRYTGEFSMLYFLNDYKTILQKAYVNGVFDIAVRKLLLGEFAECDVPTVEALAKSSTPGDQEIAKFLIREVNCNFTSVNIEGKQIECKGLLYKSFLEDFVKDTWNLNCFQTKVYGGEEYYVNFKDKQAIPVVLSQNMLNREDSVIEQNMTEKNILYMFYLHNLLGYCEQFMFTHYNPLLAGKNALKQSVQLQKRNKANYTPGYSLNLDSQYIDEHGEAQHFIDPENQNEKIIYFVEYKRDLEKYDSKMFNHIWDVVAKRYGEYDETHTLKRDEINFPRTSRIMNMYRNINSTDGQGLKTLSSYRKVVGCTSQWTPQMESDYRTIMKMKRDAIMDAAKSIGITDETEAMNSFEARMKARYTAEQIDKLNELESRFQPLKPHTSSVEYIDAGGGEKYGVGLEHKLSETIIMPELFGEDSRYKALAVMMEMNDIDTAMSQECVKVGDFNNIHIFTNSEDGLFDAVNEEENGHKTTRTARYVQKSIQAAIDGKMLHSVPFKDLTIQNNVPFHMEEEQLVGTQMRKHMIDGLLRIAVDKQKVNDSSASIFRKGAYNLVSKITSAAIKKAIIRVGDKTHEINLADEYNGYEHALKFYNMMVCSTFRSSADKLADKLSSAKKLSNTIISLKSNDRMDGGRATYQYALNGKGDDFEVSLLNPLSIYDAEDTLTSLFKKEVLKQHMSGGSAVQMSDAGFGYDLHSYFGENNNYAECAITWNFHYTDKNGKVVNLKYSDYVDNEGRLKYVKVNTDGTIKEIEENNYPTDKDIKDNNLVTKIEHEFPGILDMIAYRIPTERDYSMLNLKAVRFLPKVMGGVIVTPFQYVCAAGFDFDIDKLYYFQREYKERRKFSQRYINNLMEGQSRALGKYKEETLKKILGNEKYYYDLAEIYKADKEEYDKLKRFAETKKINSVKDFIDGRLPKIIKGITTTALSYAGVNQLKKFDESQMPELKDLKKYVGRLQNIQARVAKGNANLEAELANFNEIVDNLHKFASDYGFNGENLTITSNYVWWHAGMDNITGKKTFNDFLEDYYKEHPEEKEQEENIKKENKEEIDKARRSRFENVEESEEGVDIMSLSTVERNNLLFDFMQSRLNDSNTDLARYIPGGFIVSKDGSNMMKVILSLANDYKSGKETSNKINDIIKNKDLVRYAENEMREGNANDILYRPISIFTTALYNARNLIAKDIVGVMANHCTNMVFSQALNEMTLKNDIQMFGNSYHDLLGQSPIKSGNKFIPNDAMSYIAELLAASVDAVKDPVLNFLNINHITANTAALMCRLGMTPFQVGLFLNQPIIQKLCQRMEDYGSSNIQSSAEGLFKSLYGKDNTLGFSAESVKSVTKSVTMHGADIFTEDELAYNIVKGQEDTDDQKDFDKAVLIRFLALSVHGSALSDFIKRTKYTAANSIDNRLGSFIASQLNVDYEKESTIDKVFNIRYKQIETPNADNKTQSEDQAIQPNLRVDSKDYYSKIMHYPFAIEQNMHDLMHYFLQKISKWIPVTSEMYSTMFRLAKEMHYRPDIPGDVVNEIIETYPLYLIQNRDMTGYKNLFNPNSLYDADGNRTYVKNPATGDWMSNGEYYTQIFPAQLNEVINFRNNARAQLDALTAEYTNDNGYIDAERYKEYEEKYKELYDDLEYDYLEFYKGYSITHTEVQEGEEVEVFDGYDSSTAYDWLSMSFDEFMKDNDILDNLEIDPALGSIRLKNNIQYDKTIMKSKLMASWDALVSSGEVDPMTLTDAEIEEQKDYEYIQHPRHQIENLGVNLLMYNIHKYGVSSQGFQMLASPDLMNSLPVYYTRKSEGEDDYSRRDMIHNPFDVRTYGSEVNRIKKETSRIPSVAEAQAYLATMYAANATDSKFVKQLYFGNNLNGNSDFISQLNLPVGTYTPKGDFGDSATITFRLKWQGNKVDFSEITTHYDTKKVNGVDVEYRKLIPAFTIQANDGNRLFLLANIPYTKNSGIITRDGDGYKFVTDSSSVTMPKSSIVKYIEVPIRHKGDYSRLSSTSMSNSYVEGGNTVISNDSLNEYLNYFYTEIPADEDNKLKIQRRNEIKELILLANSEAARLKKDDNRCN